MTLEAVETKLMWVLGQTRDPDEIRRLFYTPIARDILLNTERRGNMANYPNAPHQC
jgi:L-asparaginase